MSFIRTPEKFSKGIYQSIEGDANELIAIGRIIKAGFECSRTEIKNLKYDAIIYLPKKRKSARIQIKGTATKTLNVTCNRRSGEQFKRGTGKTRKLNKEDCDFVIGVNSHNAECYILPINVISKWTGSSKSLTQLEKYKENWDLLNQFSG